MPKTTRAFAAFITVVYILVAQPASAQAPSGLSSLYKRTARSVVFIDVFGKDGSEIATGSGFFFGATNEVATNCHVMEGAASAEVKLSDGRVVPVRDIVAEDPEHDVILFSLDTLEAMAPPIAPARNRLEPGERVVVIGAPLGLDCTISDGIVSAIREETGSVMVQITAPISAGSSGSPVVNDSGEVAGVAVSSFDDGQNLNFAVPIEYAARMAEAKNPMRIYYWGVDAKSSATISFHTAKGYLLADDCPSALKFFEKAAAADPADPEKQYYLGYCRYMLEDYEGASEALKASLELSPGDPETCYMLGETYYMLDEIDRATNCFLMAVKNSPDDHAGARYSLGVIYGELKDRDRAMAEYKKLRKLDRKLAADLLKELKKSGKNKNAAND